MVKRSTSQTANILAGAGLVGVSAAWPGLAWAQESEAPRPASGPQVLAGSPAPPLAPALISEARAFGPRGAQDSFVEMCDTTDEPLDLAGWSLQFLRAAGRLDIVPLAPQSPLPPRGHLLLARRQYSPSAYECRGQAR